MSGLIDDLLNLSRVVRAVVHKEAINMTLVARGAVAELQNKDPDRKVGIHIGEGLAARGDPRLITIVVENLLGNAWKYTGKRSDAQIAFGEESQRDETVFYIRDNGAGFDMAYAHKLFAPFQRLHRDSEFEGTGIGLAIVQRIVSRHGGRIWAEAVIDQGATFYFTLGDIRS